VLVEAAEEVRNNNNLSKEAVAAVVDNLTTTRLQVAEEVPVHPAWGPGNLPLPRLCNKHLLPVVHHRDTNLVQRPDTTLTCRVLLLPHKRITTRMPGHNKDHLLSTEAPGSLSRGDILPQHKLLVLHKLLSTVCVGVSFIHSRVLHPSRLLRHRRHPFSPGRRSLLLLRCVFFIFWCL
jgi:hypothetical protein